MHALLGNLYETKGDMRVPSPSTRPRRSRATATSATTTRKPTSTSASAYAELNPPKKNEAIQQLQSFWKITCKGALAAKFGTSARSRRRSSAAWAARSSSRAALRRVGCGPQGSPTRRYAERRFRRASASEKSPADTGFFGGIVSARVGHEGWPLRGCRSGTVCLRRLASVDSIVARGGRRASVSTRDSGAVSSP